MADKVILCRCEDVTLGEVNKALSLGHRDLESVKRYTGVATGHCQGKHCLAACAHAIHRGGGEVSEPITPRPPYHPVPLYQLATLIDEEEPS